MEKCQCMITDIYLVDCENIGNQSLNLPENCDIYYFLSYGKLKNPHPNDIVKEIVHNGSKNALDFILDSWLGYLIHKYGTEIQYHIVSNDKGFSAIITYWKSLNVSISLEAYQDIMIKKINKNILKTHNDIETLLDSLPDNKKRSIKNIYTNWKRCKKKKRTSILNNLKQCLDGTCSKKEITQICDYLIQDTANKKG